MFAKRFVCFIGGLVCLIITSQLFASTIIGEMSNPTLNWIDGSDLGYIAGAPGYYNGSLFPMGWYDKQAYAVHYDINAGESDANEYLDVVGGVNILISRADYIYDHLTHFTSQAQICV